MRYLPPWIVSGTHRLPPEALDALGPDYRRLLDWLSRDGHHAVEDDGESLLDVHTLPERVRL